VKASSTDQRRPLITVQLCTYNRRALLGRVLEALFHQDLDPKDYEIILVDDGSNDGTYEEILRNVRPTCAFHLIRQHNAGLARGRNVGIERARGEIILFMDDDVLATPSLLSVHVRFHREHRRTICRGVAINVESFDNLPPPKYSLRHYSGAYFWTTNVSVPRELMSETRGFDERFREYGWEDLELGFRLAIRSQQSERQQPARIGFGWLCSPQRNDLAVLRSDPPRLVFDSQAGRLRARTCALGSRTDQACAPANEVSAILVVIA